MERETALRQLRDMREEILTIYAETERCAKIQKRAEALQNEKEHPAQPKVSLKPENTAERLRQNLLTQNRAKSEKSRAGEGIVKGIHVLLQILICALLALDLFGGKGIVIKADTMAVLTQFGSSNTSLLFAVQALASLMCVLAMTARKFFSNRRVVMGGLLGLSALFYFYMMGVMVGAWTYVILTAVCAALPPIALWIVNSANRKKRQNPTLTAAQKKQVQEAAQADEAAKKANAQARAEAQKKAEAEHERRLPQIDRELRDCVQEFEQARGRVGEHMARLNAMDCLCEEDKTLQIVELLIRFIETRRADSIKEALREYDKLVANQKLLEIEKQKLQAELQRTASEHADRMQKLEAEKRHQSEMEYLARDNARQRAQIVSQLDNIGNIIYYDLHF